LGVGKSAIIVFWSFLGWEAIAHLAEEFKDPNRDMLRAAVAAAIMVGVLYLVVSYVLIGSGATNDSKHMAPLVTFAGKKLGGVGRVFIGVVAGLVCLGTMNAYMAGLSRLGYSMARDGDLPKIFAKIDGKGTPQNSLILQFALNSMALAVQSIFKIELKTFFLIPNLSFLILYILGCVASGKLLKGRPLAVFSAYFSAAVCLVILPFALGVWIVPAIILAAAILRNSLKSKA
jgi:amino acid efflux transporter